MALGIFRRWSGATVQDAHSAPVMFDSVDFRRKQAVLARLLREFDAAPDAATLVAERQSCFFLGQDFVSEGETLPDGAIRIFYDPEMSEARMGCCLAHELQHARYFIVREAYHAERPDGPLHGRFAAYTPQLLAARGGVSDYSREHWREWKGASLPLLFSMELEEGGSEPINETIAEVAKALYNWGADVAIDPVWRALHDDVNLEFERLRGRSA